jgi:hypothetical protein
MDNTTILSRTPQFYQLIKSNICFREVIGDLFQGKCFPTTVICSPIFACGKMTDSLSSKEHYIRCIHDDRLINRSQVELSTLERMRVANEQRDRTRQSIMTRTNTGTWMDLWSR